MGASQRRKGATGEREVARILREHGLDGRRTALLQTHGVAGAADVVGIDGWHIEVKRQERICVEQWCRQAERDAGEKHPLVIWRRSQQPWRVTLTLDDFLRLVALERTPSGGDSA